MNKFGELVAIEPVGLEPWAEEKLKDFAGVVTMYGDIPYDDDAIVNRIGSADAVLLSYTSVLSGKMLARCPQVRYVGMCCSLYSPESANVDISYAESNGITVTGIRDYGDEGVVEYVVSELVRCLHGFGMKPWFGRPSEITGLKVGMVGLGKSGGMIADAMRYFGAEVSYFARGEKPAAATKGYCFMPLGDMLEWSDVVFCCLNKNTVLIGQEEFKRLGRHKILFNTGLSPAWEADAFGEWINGDNLCFCDSAGALGDAALMEHPNVRCACVSSGMTLQAVRRLSHKVIDNIEQYLNGRLL